MNIKRPSLSNIWQNAYYSVYTEYDLLPTSIFFSMMH